MRKSVLVLCFLLLSFTENTTAQSTVDSAVRSFLGNEIITIILNPNQVESFQLSPRWNPKKRDALGGFPITKKGYNLMGNNLKIFQSLVSSRQSYHFGFEKRCFFRPEMGLRFIKNGVGEVDIILSFSCKLWRFVHNGVVKSEDFDPISIELDRINQSLF